MSVISGSCVGGAGGNDPTPNTLLVSGDVFIDQITIVSANGGQIAQLPWFSGIPVGNYKIEYVGGFIPWQSTSLSCLPVTTDIVGDSTGDTVAGFIASWGMDLRRITAPNTIVFENFTGLECGVCGLVDTCDTGALQANTIAINPISTFQVDSTTFGTGGGNVASCPVVGCNTLGASTFRGGGSETWRIIQTSHVYEQPPCVRIKDYAAVKAQLGTCAVCTDPATWCAAHPAFCAGPTSEWDGTFPVRRVFFPSADDYRVNFYADPNVDNAQINFLSFTLNGKAIATAFPNVFTGISYRTIAGVGYWELRIICYLDPASGFVQAMWVGKKMTGTDPIGEYTLDATSDSCSTAPGTICIEACP